MKPRIKLSKEEREAMVAVIKGYFLEERGEEIGDLAAGIFLDIVSEQMGPHYYNKGVRDAVSVLNDKLDDIYSLEIYPTAKKGDV